MPNYDLRCQACGHTYEEFQPMDTPMPVKCPHCGKKKVRRAFLKAVAAFDNYPAGHPRKGRGTKK
jgi:putative FmdB family regulatory protein